MSSYETSNRRYMVCQVAARSVYRPPRGMAMPDVTGNLHYDSDGWTTDEEIFSNLREPVEAVADGDK